MDYLCLLSDELALCLVVSHRSQWRCVRSAPVTKPGVQSLGGSSSCSFVEHPGVVQVEVMGQHVDELCTL